MWCRFLFVVCVYFWSFLRGVWLYDLIASDRGFDTLFIQLSVLSQQCRSLAEQCHRQISYIAWLSSATLMNFSYDQKTKKDQKMKMNLNVIQSSKWRWPKRFKLMKNEHDLKNEDDIKDKNDLKNEILPPPKFFAPPLS